MDYTRNAEPSAHDGKLVVVSANGQVAPEVEIVRVTDLVQRKSTPAIKQNDGALDRGHLNGAEVSIEDEHGQRKRVNHLSVGRWKDRHDSRSSALWSNVTAAKASGGGLYTSSIK
jgi:hypothetical protein